MARIELERITKVYPNGAAAVRDLTLAIEDGELLVLVGPSGCGKSTALRLIAGLEQPTGGSIRIGGRDVTGVPPQDRDVAMVFQSYALYPHMSVRENLGFGLRMRKRSADEIAGRVDRVAEILGLGELLDRRPAQLSGGQRQRVALGRALVREPQAFLLDEPLSNLDAKLRVETRAELSRLHRRLQATMVYVTHDQEEAMTLGGRVAVLKDGILQHVAPPMELYREPNNLFVAGFIGSPAMNFFEGGLRRAHGGGSPVEHDRQGEDGWTFEGRGFVVPIRRPSGATDGMPVVLGARPQEVRIVAAEDGSDPAAGFIAAEVSVVEPIGSVQIVHCTTAGGEGVIAVTPSDVRLEPGAKVAIRIPADAAYLFSARDGMRIRDAGLAEKR
jgi:multiple sugar transport system ATP-binding protein